MRAMKLDAVKSGHLAAAGRSNEVFGRAFDLGHCHRPGAGLLVIGRAQRLLAGYGFHRPHAGMVELDHRVAVLGTDRR
jgi:hypothetical protein